MRVGEVYEFDERGLVFYPHFIQLLKYVSEEDYYIVICQWFKDEENPIENPDTTSIYRQDILDHYIKREI